MKVITGEELNRADKEVNHTDNEENHTDNKENDSEVKRDLSYEDLFIPPTLQLHR